MLRHLDPAVLTISIAVSLLALFSARGVPFQSAARTSGETIDGAVDKDWRLRFVFLRPKFNNTRSAFKAK